MKISRERSPSSESCFILSIRPIMSAMQYLLGERPCWHGERLLSPRGSRIVRFTVSPRKSLELLGRITGFIASRMALVAFLKILD